MEMKKPGPETPPPHLWTLCMHLPKWSLESSGWYHWFLTLIRWPLVLWMVRPLGNHGTGCFVLQDPSGWLPVTPGVWEGFHRVIDNRAWVKEFTKMRENKLTRPRWAKNEKALLPRLPSDQVEVWGARCSVPFTVRFASQWRDSTSSLTLIILQSSGLR